MELATAVSLIEKGIDLKKTTQTWADLGSGDGLFTMAILSILPSAKVFAIDRSASALSDLRRNASGDSVETLAADFLAEPLPFKNIDGVIMANSLHFVQHQHTFLRGIKECLYPDGRIILVEYDTEKANQWVPYPIAFEKLGLLAIQAGYSKVQKLHSVPSRYQGMMYAALLSQ